ncbi:MAG TPA: hypothetical protein VGJ94_01235 [Syntrophorhabdaceae bacterium]|jgi:hypothetical protein
MLNSDITAPRNGIITVFFATLVLILISAHPTLAGMVCSDVDSNNPKYHEKMDELAAQAKLPDDYWNKYHESVISDLCRGDIKGIDRLIDSGYVDAREAQRIAEVLGKRYTAKPRTEEGKRYEYLNKRFSKMGACSACADNIAQYHMKKPDSPCGTLAKKALAGDPEAIKKLVEFPDYCKWRY